MAMGPLPVQIFLVSFLIAMIKYLTRSDLKKEGIYVCYLFLYHGREGMGWEQEVAHHITLMVKKPEEVNAATQLASPHPASFSFFIKSGTQPMGCHCHVQDRSFPLSH